MKKTQQFIIIFLLSFVILLLSLKAFKLSQVDILNIEDNNNGTYTVEIQQGNDNFTYHFEE